MVALAWLGVMLLLILGLLVSALHLEASVSERGAAFEVRWLLLAFGVDTSAREFRLALLSWTVLRRKFSQKEESQEEKLQKPKKPKGPGRKVSPTRLIAERRALLALGRYLWRHLHWPRFNVSLIVATPDPALTGELFGYLSALAGVMPEGSLRVASDFLAEYPRGRAEVALRVRIFVLVVVLLRALQLRRRVSRRG